MAKILFYRINKAILTDLTCGFEKDTIEEPAKKRGPTGRTNFYPAKLRTDLSSFFLITSFLCCTFTL
jgi:hypothetical protein